MRPYIYSLIGSGSAVLLWHIIVKMGLVSLLFVESPDKVFLTLINLFVYQDKNNIAYDLASTLFRTAVGFLTSAAIGIPVGIILGYSEKAYHLLGPLVQFIRSIAAPAVFSLFILLVGIGNPSIIATVVFACAPIVTINTMYGVRNSNKERVEDAENLGATKLFVLRKIVFMESLPDTFVGLRQIISISLVVVVFSEMFVGTGSGLGERIYNAHLTYRIAEMYAVIILTGLVGYLLNIWLNLFEKRAIPWAGKR